MRKLRVVVIDVHPARKSRLIECLKSASEIELIAECDSPAGIIGTDLAHEADAILISAELTMREEFAEFALNAAKGGTAVVPISNFPLAAAETAHPSFRQICSNAESSRDTMAKDRATLLRTICSAVERSGSVRPPLTSLMSHSAHHGTPDPIIVIGASTGGVEALLRILENFPADCPPTLIVQHMKGPFVAGFAKRLQRACAADVGLAVHGDLLQRGKIFVAPGGPHHLEIGGWYRPACQLVAGEMVSGHCPSVDRLFLSAAESRSHVVGVLLTGMGRDGAQGLLRIRECGGTTIIQDAQTCVVYGMPRAAAELGAAELQLPLDRIAKAALSAARHASDGVH